MIRLWRGLALYRPTKKVSSGVIQSCVLEFSTQALLYSDSNPQSHLDLRSKVCVNKGGFETRTVDIASLTLHSAAVYISYNPNMAHGMMKVFENGCAARVHAAPTPFAKKPRRWVSIGVHRCCATEARQGSFLSYRVISTFTPPYNGPPMTSIH
jgi:hypothetical protein